MDFMDVIGLHAAGVCISAVVIVPLIIGMLNYLNDINKR